MTNLGKPVREHEIVPEWEERPSEPERESIPEPSEAPVDDPELVPA